MSKRKKNGRGRHPLYGQKPMEQLAVALDDNRLAKLNSIREHMRALSGIATAPSLAEVIRTAIDHFSQWYTEVNDIATATVSASVPLEKEGDGKKNE